MGSSCQDQDKELASHPVFFHHFVLRKHFKKCPNLYKLSLNTRPVVNAGFLWREVKWKSLSHVRLFATPWTIHPWNSPGQNTGVGSLSLLQGTFPTQGSNPGLSHCRQILYCLSHQRGLRRLEWVTYPFCIRSSHPRNQTGVSCIAGGFFTSWIRDVPLASYDSFIKMEEVEIRTAY